MFHPSSDTYSGCRYSFHCLTNLPLPLTFFDIASQVKRVLWLCNRHAEDSAKVKILSAINSTIFKTSCKISSATSFMLVSISKKYVQSMLFIRNMQVLILSTKKWLVDTNVPMDFQNPRFKNVPEVTVVTNVIWSAILHHPFITTSRATAPISLLTKTVVIIQSSFFCKSLLHNYMW